MHHYDRSLQIKAACLQTKKWVSVVFFCSWCFVQIVGLLLRSKYIAWSKAKIKINTANNFSLCIWLNDVNSYLWLVSVETTFASKKTALAIATSARAQFGQSNAFDYQGNNFQKSTISPNIITCCQILRTDRMITWYELLRLQQQQLGTMQATTTQTNEITR